MAKNLEKDQQSDADSDLNKAESEERSEVLTFHSIMDQESSSKKAASEQRNELAIPLAKETEEPSAVLPGLDVIAFLGARDNQRKEQPEADDKSEKGKLANLAEKLGSDPKSLELFKADLETIERHVQDGKLSRTEADAVFKETQRLISTESKVGVSGENRSILGRQIIHNTAHPSAVDQGRYDNCNVAAPELRLYHRNPGSMAKLVADAALTGKYTASNGQTVDVTRSVQPADKNHLKVPSGENERSYASQLYHSVSVNLAVLDKYPGKKFEYVQQAATDTDNGARLLDISLNPPKEIYAISPEGTATYHSTQVKDEKGRPSVDAGLQPVMTNPMGNPGLTIQDSFNTMEKITGKKEVGACITHYEQGGYATNWILDKVGLSGHARRDTRIPYFSNEAELKNVLNDAKKANLFPILLQVNTGSGFLGKQVEQAAGKPLGGEGAGFGGGHVLCLKDYDPATGKIGVDNTWGTSRDKLGTDSVTLQDIVTISQTDAKLTARSQEFNNQVQAAYKYWCRENKKTPGVHYPSSEVGKVWLQRYKRELQKALENSAYDYPSFFY